MAWHGYTAVVSERRWNMDPKITVAIVVLVAALAWISYAAHPTARRLRQAIIDTAEALVA